MTGWEGAELWEDETPPGWEGAEVWQEESSASWFDELGRTARGLEYGVAKLGKKFGDLPRNIAMQFDEEFANKYLPEAVSEQQLAQLFGMENPEMRDVITSAIGEFGPEALVPGAAIGKAGKAISSIPKAGPYLAAAAEQFIPQAALGAVSGLQQSPEQAVESGIEQGAIAGAFGGLAHGIESQSPTLRLLSKLGIAGGGAALGYGAGELVDAPYLGTAAGAGLGALGAMLPGSQATRNRIMQSFEPQDAQKTVNAARELGINLTPGEATGLPYPAQLEGKVGLTKEGSKALSQSKVARDEQLKGQINDFVSQIYDKGSDIPKIKQDLYESALNTMIPDEVAIDLMGYGPVMEEAMKKVGRSSTHQQEIMKKGYTENNIGYWDRVKRELDQKASQASRKGANADAAEYKRAADELRNKLDLINPDYKEARHYAERGFTADMIKDSLQKGKGSEVTKFGKMLEDPKKFQELLGKLSYDPELQKTLVNMKEVYPKVIGPETARTAYGQSKRGMDKQRGPYDISTIISEYLAPGRDVKAVEFLTSPDWLEQATKYQSSKKIPDYLAQGTRYLGRFLGAEESEP